MPLPSSYPEPSPAAHPYPDLLMPSALGSARLLGEGERRG